MTHISPVEKLFVYYMIIYYNRKTSECGATGIAANFVILILYYYSTMYCIV